jgi:GTP-binding protein
MKHANLFVDEVDLEVRSGAGGDGIVSFRREKFVAKGGPNGGDGGRGGDVVLVADTNVSTLLDLKSTRTIRAASGAKGGGQDKKGASGTPVEVHVPVGTLVFDLDSVNAETGEASLEEGRGGTTWGEEQALVDLTQPGQRFVIARGGTGGLGNARFKTATRQAPDFATPGKPGETRRIRLSLSAISAARPRIASYPFTTLVPSLGVVERDDRRCVVADIPGLIEGASEGAGLGHRFLRHVERTRVLVHLLDLEAMLVEGRDLLADYAAIHRELERFQPELLERREIVVLSKSDLVHDEALLEPLLARLAERGIEPLRISAAARQGLEPLVHAIFDAVEQAQQAQTDERGEPSASRGAQA